MKDEQWKEDNSSKHNQDVVMPGFRFHPTEEELVEFYLRRKVEGKHFNIELITFVDLYRYDPWELPALAAIGEKEWFFYVPRDRKYRNGDRPNRVTASGYWKATGADRMIRNENSCCIGLKKTLVFYRGKAPKGKRTSWIMNEYRLPQLETERIQKNELSLCRVYRKAGTEEGRIDSKDSHNLSVTMNGNRESPVTATSDSFSTRPCHTYKEVNSSNTNFNFKGVTNELPAALKICESGDCKLLVGERFPAQMEYGVAALQNMQDSGNMWDINRPMGEDIELSLTTCLYSRPPHQLPLPVPVPTVEDLYNTPPHILGVFGNGFTYNSGLPSCSDKLWEWNPVRNNGAPAD